MRRKLIALAVLIGLAAVGSAQQGPPVDPLLTLLIKKGVITAQEAQELQGEYRAMKRQAAEKQQETASAVARTEARKVVAEAAPSTLKLPTFLNGFKIGVEAYISFQDGKRYKGVPGETSDYSQFTLKRGYLNITKKISPHFEARLTPDVHQDSTGDWKARFKYVYGKFKWQGSGVLGKPYIEFGLAHMPWLDFEEHINRFRMQDPMFMERSGLFNSADVGIMFGANLGGELPESYRKNVNGHYAGRYGSFQVGIYNGAGYHAKERNTNKVVEARLSLRPLSTVAPGLQLSLFGVTGKGNTAAEPDWNLFSTMLSWESPRLVLTGQYVTGTGNQNGSAIDAAGRSLDRDGYSAFTEIRLGAKRDISLIGRYDHFDPDTHSLTNDQQDRWIAGIAWQFLKGNYWLLDYQNVQHDNPLIPNEGRIQLTLQVKY
ncbi:MAG: hypothetical protein GXP48_11410 [Acidobacteria bacterium]|nr:hypothetical protein [Acidobacteriota bacterium]